MDAEQLTNHRQKIQHHLKGGDVNTVREGPQFELRCQVSVSGRQVSAGLWRYFIHLKSECELRYQFVLEYTECE